MEECVAKNNRRNKEELLVSDFPYEDLCNVSPADLDYVRKCLPYLLPISQSSLFYTNVKAIKSTLEFTIGIINDGPFHDSEGKETFEEVLVLLKEVLLGSMKNNKFSEVFRDISMVFDLMVYVSDLDIFCTKFANICEPVLQQLLNNVQDYTMIDTSLSRTLNNFQNVGAHTEISKLSETVLHGFPLDSSTYKLCASWLLENSVMVVSQLPIGHPENDLKFVSIMSNIVTLLLKVAFTTQSNSIVERYKGAIFEFMAELKSLTPKLIQLCGREATVSMAKKLLGHVLFFFLEEQDMHYYEATRIIREEIENFPASVDEWAKQCCSSFFWLCHLIYYHERCVWSTGDICDAIGRLLYNKKHHNIINPYVLKSVCFIYPITIQSDLKIRKKRIIGDDLLNVVLPMFMPFLHKILTISTQQLLWIIYKGSWTMKIAMLKFWLEKSPPDKMAVLEDVLVATKSQKLLIDVLLSLKDPKEPVSNKVTKVIQNLHGRVAFKEILALIPRLSDNMEIASMLLETVRCEVPEDKITAMNLFDFLYLVLTKHPEDSLLANVCSLASNALNVLKTDKNFMHAIYTEQFWIRFLISRLNGVNERLLKAILDLLTKLITYQDKPDYFSEPLIINLSPLFTVSPEVSAKVVGFLYQALKVRTSLLLKEDIVLDVFAKLCDLTETPHIAGKVYGCLMGLLKLYPTELIHSPILGMLVEEKCRLPSRKMYTAESLKFVLFWIKIMHHSRTKTFAYLPQEGALTMFFQRSMGIPTYTVSRYLFYISEIYNREESSNDTDEDMSLKQLFHKNQS